MESKKKIYEEIRAQLMKKTAEWKIKQAKKRREREREMERSG